MGRRSHYRLAIPFLAAVSLGLLGIPPAQAAPMAYTALGDSYSSGVGTRTYFSDSGSCYRSPVAYPVLTANSIGAQLTFAACSGARIPDMASQIGSLNADTGLVTVSIGGNDAGFVDVITRCALPWPWTCWGEINTANDFIRNTLPGQLDGVYDMIRTKAPNAQVIVVGYPRIFNGEECNFGARISSGEQAELNKSADLLTNVIGARAAAHGFGFVDPRSAYTSHAICDDVEWVNGLSDPILESYHPNTFGQSGYARMLQTRLGVPVNAA
jgi:lysophospholipase L1-like esterase